MKPVNVVLHTDGEGLWSEVAKAVTVNGLSLNLWHADEAEEEFDLSFGELQVKFDLSSWDPREDGLIYTDRRFEDELRAYLNSIGLKGDDVDYSEQGMQGDDYVSCDVGADFIESWLVKYGPYDDSE